jgi:glycine/D-amino acid oxidase-like deaminating enzyme
MPVEGEYDYLIVGAGLAGLHCALNLKKKYASATIAVAEAYNYFGGRVVSYTPKGFRGISWENGAGRIHNSHKMVLSYIQKYGLTLHQISPTQSWKSIHKHESYPNTWPSLAHLVHALLSRLSPNTLATNTVRQLLTDILGKEKTNGILNHFPYRAEMDVMRADMALLSLEETMGTNNGFYVVKEGLSALIHSMVVELENLGVVFHLGHRCFEVDNLSAHFKTKGGLTSLKAKKIILALHNSAMKSIAPFSNLPVLKKVVMCPLLRTYAIFPTKNQVSWFSDIPHSVTDSPIRYFIPINPMKGVVMTSYTDAGDTSKFSRILSLKGEEALKDEIMDGLRKLFPEKKIPEPKFFKAHMWYEGCSYWAPGLYDPIEESRAAMRPLPRFPNVFLCGESWSLKQCWMEGALEHSDEMLNRYFL